MLVNDPIIERRLQHLRDHLLGSHINHTIINVNSASGSCSENICKKDEFLSRAIQTSDYEKGYLKLLSQLTSVGDISKEAFIRRLEQMDKEVYRIVVIEDPNSHKIVAAATVFVEVKFVHNCGQVGHIEDVVVDETVRGKHLGVKVIEACKQFAKEKGCYKIILDCSEKNVQFYQRCGFQKKELQMRFDYEQ